MGDRVTAVRNERSWTRAIFHVRQGPEMSGALLAVALALLLVEASIAASGRTPTRRAREAQEGTRDPS